MAKYFNSQCIYRTDKKGKTEVQRCKWRYLKAITMILKFFLLGGVGLLVGVGRN